MMTAAAFEEIFSALHPHFGQGEARSLCCILFEDVLDWHTGRRDRELTAEEEQQLQQIQDRLLAGEPLQYILGQADFYNIKLAVSPAVLIPRPETEELVEWVLEEGAMFPTTPRILDIGTGSGCIPVAVKHAWPDSEIWAIDVSEPALLIARQNANRYEATIYFQQVDILDATQRELLPQFDMIVSNPPYIPHQESDLMSADVLLHEPALALFVPDEDPLVFYRHIMAFAQTHLLPNGQLFFECNEFNAAEVAELGNQLGFQKGELRNDLQRKPRMWRGRKG